MQASARGPLGFSRLQNNTAEKYQVVDSARRIRGDLYFWLAFFFPRGNTFGVFLRGEASKQIGVFYCERKVGVVDIVVSDWSVVAGVC
jgi:hypothetical protein